MNVMADSGLRLLKHAVLHVLYEAGTGYPITQGAIREKLGIPQVEEPSRTNSLIYGILAHLRDDGHAVHHSEIGWKITPEGVSVIEGSQ